MFICGLYRQPDDSVHRNHSASKEFREIIDLLRNAFDNIRGKTPDIVLAGYFNLPHINWENDSFVCGASKKEKLMASQLFELMNDYNFTQFVKTSTHKDGNILDFLFTNNCPTTT